MVKYFVKKHSVASELVCVSSNRVQDFYYGKTPNGGFVCQNREPKSFEGTLYGFDTQAEAEELLERMQVAASEENKAGKWAVSLSVVEA